MRRLFTLRAICLFVTNLLFTATVWAFDPLVKSEKKSNPDIGLNVLLLAQGASSGSEYENGLSLQEMELQFSSNIDPYWSGYALLALHPEKEEGEDGYEYHLEPEEVYFENLGLPGFAFRVGKQKLYFGKLNNVHTHAQPFVDLPLTTSALLGEEGLNELGLSASYLVPTSWYMDMILQITNTENEQVFGRNGHAAAVLSIKNLWELNPDSTVEWILGAGTGDNSALETSKLYNTALTYKSRLAGGPKNGVALTAEYTQVDLGTGVDKQDAASAWLMYQFHKNWFAQARIEQATVYPEGDFTNTIELKKNTALIGFAPTEFSSIRLQYDTTNNSAEEEDEYRFALQFNFSLGAHPAHNY